MVSWPNHRCGHILPMITSIWTRLDLDNKNWILVEMNSNGRELRKRFDVRSSFYVFVWTVQDLNFNIAVFYLWRASRVLIMTDVRLNKSNRYFKQYKFNIDSITNKACWITKWTVCKIICNENSICVTLLLVILSRWIQIQHNAAFSWRILNQQAVCLHKNIFTNLHDMQRELSHIKSSLIMSNHCKLMSCDWLPPFAYFIIY